MVLIADVKTLLAGVDTTNCYLGDMPNLPDNIIALYNTGGFPPNLTLDGCKYENPTFQVRVRNLSYVAGIAKCEAIKYALASVSNITINATRYLAIRQMSDILSMGKDSNNRTEFSINFQAVLAK